MGGPRSKLGGWRGRRSAKGGEGRVEDGEEGSRRRVEGCRGVEGLGSGGVEFRF